MQGGTADSLNNLEQVLIKSPTPGSYTLKVKGTNIPMGPQGYAIVVSGDLTTGNGGNQSPVAEANGPYSGKRNVPISFSSASSVDPDGSIMGYSWNSGDGSLPSSDPNPRHTYTTTGSFTATLTVTDNSGAIDTDTAAVKVTR
jgi:microbial collagenase